MISLALAYIQHCRTRFLLAAAAMLLIIPQVYSQVAMDYAVQCNIIYRFTKYVDWPESRKSGDFIIGIVGETPLYDEMKSFSANKIVGAQKIVVKRFKASSGSYDCHILFVGEDESGNLRKIAARTANDPVLLISEANGLARKGSCINFVVIQERIKLEINKDNIVQRDLSIATELLSLGIAIQ